MLKGRLNQYMRAEMVTALIEHGFGPKRDALAIEANDLRNIAIERQFSSKQVAAFKVVAEAGGEVTRVSRVAINAGGPKIEVGAAAIFGYRSEDHAPAGAVPLPYGLGIRLDLAADDELAKRAQAFGDAFAEFSSELKVASEQVRAALAAFATVSQLQASWPDAIPVVESIIIEHLGRPAASLPAVVLAEMNAKLGLPPSNDDAEELAQAA